MLYFCCGSSFQFCNKKRPAQPLRLFVGEWLSLVEHLVRDQGVGGSNPLSPTNISLALSLFSHFAAIDFPPLFGTTRGNSKPIACSRTRTHVRFAEKVNGGTGRYTV